MSHLQAKGLGFRTWHSPEVSLDEDLSLWARKLLWAEMTSSGDLTITPGTEHRRVPALKGALELLTALSAMLPLLCCLDHPLQMRSLLSLGSAVPGSWLVSVSWESL